MSIRLLSFMASKNRISIFVVWQLRVSSKDFVLSARLNFEGPYVTKDPDWSVAINWSKWVYKGKPSFVKAQEKTKRRTKEGDIMAQTNVLWLLRAQFPGRRGSVRRVWCVSGRLLVVIWLTNLSAVVPLMRYACPEATRHKLLKIQTDLTEAGSKILGKFFDV